MIEQKLELLEQHDFLNQLNKYQKEAVTDESKALILNAHVGSGKTTVLIAKVLYLHLKKNVEFSDMVVLTFTNKAANEIKERIKKVFPEITDEEIPYIGTFHSVAKKFLSTILPVEEIGYTNDFTIIDPEEMLDMANRLMIEKMYNIKYRNKLLRRLESYKRGERFYGVMKYEDDIDLLWDDIENEKRKQNKMDFDDLIEHANRLLQESDFKAKWVIVDEFQDSDEAQFEFIKALSSDETKHFVVGDPNQIIYTWRGSDQQIFQKFKEHFQAKEMSLPINYRSTATILDVAKTFLSNGHESHLEGIRDQGNKIKIVNQYNAFNEADYVSDKIKELVRDGMKYNDIAILYRTQRQAKILEEVLTHAEVPYEVSVKKSLSDIPVLLWFVNLLKASVNENDKNNIIFTLRHSVFGENLTNSEIRTLLQSGRDTSSQLLNKIYGFRTWAEGKSLEDITHLYDYFNLDNYLAPTSVSYTDNKQLLVEFMAKIKEFMNEKKLNLIDGILEFVNSSTLYGLNIFDETTSLDNDSVKLMTLHACKGLEFKKVFIIGVNNGLVPLRTKSLEAYEEEKRLFFVGITRAKDELEISYYTSPDEYQISEGPSTFLTMIPEHLVDWGESAKPEKIDIKDLVNKVKERRAMKSEIEEETEVEKVAPVDEAAEQILVRHNKYGEGIVESEDDQSITVKFAGYGSKAFSKMFVQLEYL